MVLLLTLLDTIENVRGTRIENGQKPEKITKKKLVVREIFLSKFKLHHF
jgi:hypothetical protein